MMRMMQTHTARKRARNPIMIALFVAFSFPAWAQSGEDTQPFKAWLADLRTEAGTKGISQPTLDAALSNLKPIARVIELDRRQPEFTLTFRDYMERMVNDKRIAKGHAVLSKNRALLNAVAARYGVQPQIIVAFWGLETDFGRLASGYFPTVAALATLAHDGRRSAFFRKQLMAALKILDQGHIDNARLKGSWAGAMGHFQFIPTTFAAHAIDYDGDGKRDIWTNTQDAVGSAGNFLKASGWRAGELWGREVKLPTTFDYTLATLKVKKGLDDWQALGIRRTGGADLPRADVVASVVAPAGHAGPAFLVYNNFRATMRWNQSIFYAIAVGHLADRLVGKGALSTLGPRGTKGLSFAQSEELQTLLIGAGFDPGEPDGILGSKSRAAVREYQRKNALVPDGHPSQAVLDHLRANRP